MARIIDQIPYDGIDFGYCAVHQTESRKFTIQNPFNNIVQYEIQYDKTADSSFEVGPTIGKLYFEFNQS
jgi:hypothetical protein